MFLHAIDDYRKERHIRIQTSSDDGKWYALLSKIIPDFEKYVDMAADMVEECGGIRQALKRASIENANQRTTHGNSGDEAAAKS